jgi:hypothetical protein
LGSADQRPEFVRPAPGRGHFAENALKQAKKKGRFV